MEQTISVSLRLQHHRRISLLARRKGARSRAKIQPGTKRHRYDY